MHTNLNLLLERVLRNSFVFTMAAPVSTICTSAAEVLFPVCGDDRLAACRA
ncbi:MAG: hypothetical protein ACOYOU_01540 [Kiritimatiellia bacterium]